MIIMPIIKCYLSEEHIAYIANTCTCICVQPIAVQTKQNNKYMNQNRIPTTMLLMDKTREQAKPHKILTQLTQQNRYKLNTIM